jgi:hypothetical protein
VPYLYPRGPMRASGATASRVQQKMPPGQEGEGLTPGQSRVRQLETLVDVLKRELEKRGGLPGTLEDEHGAPVEISGVTGRGVPETPGDLSGVTEPTPAGPITDEHRYVDAANWEAISDDVGSSPW